VWTSLAGLPVLLITARAMGEPFWPGTHGGHWWPLLALALGSQVFGQGLLVYALRHFSPLVVGLALLTQPAISVASGWLAFGETLGGPDWAGMLLVSASLVLARLGSGLAFASPPRRRRWPACPPVRFRHGRCGRAPIASRPGAARDDQHLAPQVGVGHGFLLGVDPAAFCQP
jgi:hypothetical protein